LQHSPRGRVRLALGVVRQHPLITSLWGIAFALLTIATAFEIEPLRAWAVLIGLSASALSSLAMTRHAISRLTQIVSYFVNDVQGCTHDSGASLRSVKP
jgi:hypothetical protein